MKGDQFFEERTVQSLVKMTIVSEYFEIWANIMIRAIQRSGGNRINYIDLFAGRGRYKDGSPSTPLLVLEKAIRNIDLRDRLVAIFNDKDTSNADVLRNTIDELEGINTLQHPPRVFNYEICDSTFEELLNQLEGPALIFFDPCGYKGLSQRLFQAFLKRWGSDCIIFFNYNRINPAINNESVKEHMVAMFGEARAEDMTKELSPLPPEIRERRIIHEMARALKEIGGEYVLPFCFKNNEGTRTSHYLFFTSKNFLGYDRMKEIMAKQSSNAAQGVPSFEYCPADENCPTLFELRRPLDDLGGMLLTDFAGQVLTFKELYERHSIGKPFVRNNYKNLLIDLEEKETISVEPPANKRKRLGQTTLGDKVKLIFPAED